MKRPRWVLDTNVFVAAARSSRGASAELVRCLAGGRFQLLLSVPMALEYEAVLKRPEQLVAAHRTASTVGAMLDAVCQLAEPVHFHFLWRPQTRDPADEMVLETALNGAADALVTLNVRDFQAAARFGLLVFTPGAAVTVLRQGG